VEINGPRKAAWGAPQSREFQTTPAFTALRRDATLASAIAGAPYPAQQMVFWMRELSEIAVLDHIFSQQDRVGNIENCRARCRARARNGTRYIESDTDPGRKNCREKDRRTAGTWAQGRDLCGAYTLRWREL
jgi:hypothetical protein